MHGQDIQKPTRFTTEFSGKPITDAFADRLFVLIHQ
jgi:hypothetical protein